MKINGSTLGFFFGTLKVNIVARMHKKPHKNTACLEVKVPGEDSQYSQQKCGLRPRCPQILETSLHTPSLHGSALIGFTSWQRQQTLKGRKQAIHLLYILITYVCSLSTPWPRIILHKWPPGGELSIPVLKIGTTLNTAEIIFCSWKVPQQVCMMGAELRCPLVTMQFTV